MIAIKRLFVLAVAVGLSVLLLPVQVSAAEPGCYQETDSGYEATSCPSEGAARAVSQFGACFVGSQERDCDNLGRGGNAVPESESFTGQGCDSTKSILGIPTWYKYLEAEIDSTGRCSPRVQTTGDALPIGIAVLEGALRLAGLVAVAMIFVASFRFITSEGSADNAAAARKTAINALVGLVIVILSTAIVSFVGNRLG